MQTKFKFTKTALDEVTCPEDKAAVRVSDTLTPGLTLRVTRNGARAYYLYRKVNGRPLEVRIEGTDKITLDGARGIAAELNGKIAQGLDPRTQKRAAREAATLADLWETYRKAVVKQPRTMEEDEGVYTRYLEPWASRRLSDVTDEAVQMLHNRIAAGKMDRESKDSLGRVRKVKGGPTAARLAVALLSGMFSECGKTFGMAGNPARGVRKERPNARERYLSSEELVAFWKALEGQSEGMRDLFKMALFTAQRRSTLLAMRWDEVNLTFGTWTIPAEKMKGGKSHVVPLIGQAMEILKRRREAAEEGAEWVFPGPGETGHVQEVKKALAAAVKAAGIAEISLHDLRRTCATWMDSTGASLSTIQHVLAQRPQTVVGIHYVMATTDGARKALQAAADAMAGAAGVKITKPQVKSKQRTQVTIGARPKMAI